MKINEVEAAVGVTKKNIRFYEEEGLITPCLLYTSPSPRD